MGLLSDLKNAWAGQQVVASSPVVVASPKEASGSESTIQEATIEGIKSAVIAGVVSAGPVIIGCRTIPWAKAHLNHTAQALLICSATITGFFVTSDKIILERAKKNSQAKLEK